MYRRRTSLLWLLCKNSITFEARYQKSKQKYCPSALGCRCDEISLKKKVCKKVLIKPKLLVLVQCPWSRTVILCESLFVAFSEVCICKSNFLRIYVARVRLSVGDEIWVIVDDHRSKKSVFIRNVFFIEETTWVMVEGFSVVSIQIGYWC